MPDLIERLHDELTAEAEAFEPSPDLPGRVAERIRHRRQRHQVLAAAALVVVLAAGAGGLVALRGGGSGRVDIADQPSTTTRATTTSSTTSRSSTTVATTAGTTTSTTTGEAATPSDGDDVVDDQPGFDGSAPLSRSGVGPIEAGMTIAEAESVAGIDLAVDPQVWENLGRSCGTFTTPSSPYQFVAWTPDHVPGEPEDAVIRAVGGGVAGTATEEGVTVGDGADRVRTVYGEPTATDPNETFGGEVLVYEEGGFGFGIRITEGVVTDIRSGHITGFAEFEPCA
jgi:hypothetical protein